MAWHVLEWEGGGNSLQIWKLAVNILNKQSWSAVLCNLLDRVKII